MDNRIKERLTGALILVAALVIVVPEMLSGPDKKTVAGDAPPARPATEGPPLRSYTLDLDAPADKRPAGQSALNVQAPPADAPPAGEPVSETPAAPKAASPAIVAPAIVAPAIAAPAGAALSSAAKNPEPAAPAQAAAAPAAAASGWQVQVGSFAQRINAERYAKELGQKGFRAQVSSSSSNGRELFRVRVGPVADRDAAVALQSRLKAQGIRGSLAAP